MKILHGISSLGGGGAERQLRNLVCGTTDNNFQHIIFSLRMGGFQDDLERHGATVIIRPFLRWKLPLALIQLIITINKIKPDIIQSWDAQFDVLFGFLGILMGRKFIASERTSGFYYTNNPHWLNPFRGYFIRISACLIISNSRCGLEHARKISKYKISGIVIPNGIDIEQIESNSVKNVDIPDNITSFIVIASRLIPIKQTKICLDIFSEISKERKNISLVILGTGTEEDYLKDYANTLDCKEDIYFLGHVSNVAGYFNRSILFLSASSVEGLPNSVIENMFLGIPCVISRIESHEEIYNDSLEGVILFDTNNLGEGISAIEKVLDDQMYRDSVVFKAKKFADGLSIERMVTSFQEEYKKMGKT